MEPDIVIIGGGPAGYVAAIRAAQLGGRVTLVEKDKLGGICLNRGCIPTKFMLRAVETYQTIKNAERYGINVVGAGLDLAKMQAGKRCVVSTLASGVKGLLSGNRVEVLSAQARLVSPKEIEVTPPDGKKSVISTEKVIIATGAKPIALPIPGADSPDILSAEDTLELERPPRSLVIIGGGAVGVEMAMVYAKLDCQVSIIEMMSHCLPAQDDEIAAVLEKVLRDDGIHVYCSTRVNQIENTGGSKAVLFSDNGSEQKIVAEAVAISIGYRPNTEGLRLEECGISLERGRVKVNESMETSVPGVYAAGDAVGGMMLAYVAMAEGIIAAENAMGQKSRINYNAVPQCIFTMPEVASVGLAEREATAQGREVYIGRFPFVANSMAQIMGETRGLVKIIADRQYGQVLGVHIIGPQATSLIAEAAIAMKLEGTVDDIIAMIHAHPSLSEAIWEASADIRGKKIHSLSRQRSH